MFESKFIFAIGGFNKKQYLNSIEKYDLKNDVWEIIEIPEGAEMNKIIPRDLAFS